MTTCSCERGEKWEETLSKKNRLDGIWWFQPMNTKIAMQRDRLTMEQIEYIHFFLFSFYSQAHFSTKQFLICAVKWRWKWYFLFVPIDHNFFACNILTGYTLTKNLQVNKSRKFELLLNPKNVQCKKQETNHSGSHSHCRWIQIQLYLLMWGLDTMLRLCRIRQQCGQLSFPFSSRVYKIYSRAQSSIFMNKCKSIIMNIGNTIVSLNNKVLLALTSAHPFGIHNEIVICFLFSKTTTNEICWFCKNVPSHSHILIGNYFIDRNRTKFRNESCYFTSFVFIVNNRRNINHCTMNMKLDCSFYIWCYLYS